MDILTPSQRSERMRRVRREHTRPEMAVRQVAHALGYRFMLHRKTLPGSPDLIFPRLRKALFVHGCFWHFHDGCSRATVPKTRTSWWLAKIESNRARDARVLRELRQLGWSVDVIWECETRDLSRLRERIGAFLQTPLDPPG